MTVCKHDGLVYTAGGENIARVWSLELGSSVGIIKGVGGGVGVHCAVVNPIKSMLSMCGMDGRC